jgi:hypothetical protein
VGTRRRHVGCEGARCAPVHTGAADDVADGEARCALGGIGPRATDGRLAAMLVDYGSRDEAMVRTLREIEQQLLRLGGVSEQVRVSGERPCRRPLSLLRRHLAGWLRVHSDAGQRDVWCRGSARLGDSTTAGACPFARALQRSVRVDYLRSNATLTSVGDAGAYGERMMQIARVLGIPATSAVFDELTVRRSRGRLFESLTCLAARDSCWDGGGLGKQSTSHACGLCPP